MELKLKRLLESYKETLGITKNIKIEFVDLKTKIASISFKTKVLRINKNILNELELKHWEYIILHELAHLKSNCLVHSEKFYKILEEFYTVEEIKKLEEEINYIFVSKLLEQQSKITSRYPC